MTAATRLQEVLWGFDQLAVAVSGGVDSMTLAWLAHRALGERLSAFHAVSPAVPGLATARVRAYAERAGWRLRLIDAGELMDERYLANPANRCFFCKTDLYGTIRRHTDEPIASGANLDDLGDWRPGLKAAAEHGVRHPLIEAGIDKATIRALARAEGLDDLADLPAAPCLSSRIETGIRIDPARLALIEAAEGLLRAALPNPAIIRARLRPDGLEVQLDEATLGGLAGNAREALAAQLEALGAARVRFAPYRRGSAFLRDR